MTCVAPCSPLICSSTNTTVCSHQHVLVDYGGCHPTLSRKGIQGGFSLFIRVCDIFGFFSPLSLTILSSKAFARDDHILDLLSFNPRCQFHDDDCYTTGKIILQDKASCFPSVVLNPPPTDDTIVIDATAAPGNKTSHLSALMANRGKVCISPSPFQRFCILCSSTHSKETNGGFEH